MKLAYVTETYPPEINGVALTVARTVAALRTARHAVDLIRPRQPGEAARNDARDPHYDGNGEWRTAGVPIPMYADLRLGLALPATLRRRFAQTRPSLVHVATQGPLGRAAVVAANALGIPVTTDFRTHFDGYSRYYRLGWLEPVVRGYLRAFHNRAAATCVPTAQLRQSLAASGFERLAVIGRGVDTAQFSPAHRSAALRAQWGVADGAPVLLHVGRLAPEKNVALALRACMAATAAVPGARTVVVGDGPERRRLEAAFPDARFVGMQRGQALAAHYASADVFVFPSQSETFGNVTLEALASGLAVVAFDAAAAADHIVHGRSGWLAALGDDAGFIGATVEAALAVVAPAAARPVRAAAREAACAARWDAVQREFEAFLVRHARAGAAPAHADVALA